MIFFVLLNRSFLLYHFETVFQFISGRLNTQREGERGDNMREKKISE